MRYAHADESNGKGETVELEMDETECIEYGDSPCSGVVREYTSRSGATVSARTSERYPGWDTPGSVAPKWLDPSYAGESWDED